MVYHRIPWVRMVYTNVLEGAMGQHKEQTFQGKLPHPHQGTPTTHTKSTPTPIGKRGAKAHGPLRSPHPHHNTQPCAFPLTKTGHAICRTNFSFTLSSEATLCHAAATLPWRVRFPGLCHVSSELFAITASSSCLFCSKHTSQGHVVKLAKTLPVPRFISELDTGSYALSAQFA